MQGRIVVCAHRACIHLAALVTEDQRTAVRADGAGKIVREL